jgi:membrane protein implicated in regulation of membrane protease activity
MNLLSELVYWHWLLLGVILIILEVFSPGAYLLWLGLAAGATGILAALAPDLPWQAQSLIFALLSLGSVLGARQWLRKHPIKTDRPTLNRRGEQYIGREFTLQSPITHGQGKIQVDDTRWKIHGEDCPAGCRIQVIGAEGVVLQVKQLQED